MNPRDLKESKFFRDGMETQVEAPGRVEEICNYRKTALEHDCRAQMAGLRYMGQKRQAELDHINNSLNAQGIPPEQTVQADRNKGFLLLIVFLVISGGSYALSSWGFSPLEMSWRSYLAPLNLSLGLTICLFFILFCATKIFPERIILVWRIYLSTAGAVLAGASSFYICALAGDLTTLLMTRGTPAFDQKIPIFYDNAFRILKMVFPLLNLAADLAAAITLEVAISKLSFSIPLLRMLRKRQALQNELIETASELKHLEELPGRFESEFMYGATLAKGKEEKKCQERANIASKTRLPEDPEAKRAKQISRNLLILIAVLILLLLFWSRAFGAELEVIMLDLSASMGVKNQVQQSEFQKNLIGVEKVISQVKPGTEIRVFGITENSFERTYLIFHGKVSKGSPGFFGQNLRKEVNGLLEEWKKTADKMRPDARATDIFGGLFLAERVFADSMVQVKNLRIFSDLRHNVKIDLERKEVIDERLIRVVKKVYGVPDLKGVRVLMHGVHGYGKTPAYFYSLKKLFELYLREAQAELVTFSPFQEVQNE